MYGIYNEETVENIVWFRKCTTKLHGMKKYFQLDLTVSIIGIYHNKELYIIQ